MEARVRSMRQPGFPCGDPCGGLHVVLVDLNKERIRIQGILARAHVLAVIDLDIELVLEHFTIISPLNFELSTPPSLLRIVVGVSVYPVQSWDL